MIRIEDKVVFSSGDRSQVNLTTLKIGEGFYDDIVGFCIFDGTNLVPQYGSSVTGNVIEINPQGSSLVQDGEEVYLQITNVVIKAFYNGTELTTHQNLNSGRLYSFPYPKDPTAAIKLFIL